MSDYGYDASCFTPEVVEALMAFLPFLEEAGADFGGGVVIEDGVVFTATLSDRSQAFMEACYELGLVQGDWPSWADAHSMVVRDGEGIELLTLEELGLLITTHLREDRFCDGHLLHTLRSGMMARILRRIKAVCEDGIG